MTVSKLKNIPQSQRCGVVSVTPTKYIEAVVFRNPFASDEIFDAMVDEELADLKFLIKERRRRHLEEEERRAAKSDADAAAGHE